MPSVDGNPRRISYSSAGDVASAVDQTPIAQSTQPRATEDRAVLSGQRAMQLLDEGTARVLAAIESEGLDVAAFDPREVRGLGGLVGRGLVSPIDLRTLVSELKERPGALAKTLQAHRGEYLALVSRLNRVELADGSSAWTVQEIANMDWVLAQLPDRFKAVVRKGPPIVRDVANPAYTGLYNPFSNQISLADNFNGGGSSLDEVKQSEGAMRGVMIMEMSHAWQIRQTSLLNPGAGGILKGLRGVVYPEGDIVSDWSKLSGWSVRPKWSPWAWFGNQLTPNASDASHQLANAEIKLFGRSVRFNLTELRYDPAKEQTLISDYAKTDPYEDFGESAIAYVLDPEVLKRRAPEKYAYFKDRVMDGREFNNRFHLYN